MDMIVVVVIAVAVVIALALASKFLLGGSAKPATGTAAAQAAAGNKIPTVTVPAKKPEDDASLLPVDVYYGSQTGTAQRMAKQLVTQGKKLGFRVRAIDLANHKPEELASGKAPCVFLMATCGEGEFTDNALPFAAWMRDQAALAAKPLAAGNVQFTVFGLGNKTYEKYNIVGKVTNSSLEAIGGTRFYVHGEGDDSSNLDEDYEGWKDGLWAALKDVHARVFSAKNGGAAAGAASGGAGAASGGAAASSASASGDLPDLPEMPWILTPLPAPAAASLAASPVDRAALHSLASAAGISNRHFFSSHFATVARNEELRPVSGVGASTRHVELELHVPIAAASAATIAKAAGGSGVAMGAAAVAAATSVHAVPPGAAYATADNLYICPENDAGVVAKVASALGYDLSAAFTLDPAPPSEEAGAGGGPAAPLFPSPCTVRTALAEYLDLQGPVHRDFLGYLAHYATASEERARLLHLASRTGKEDFHSWVVVPQRSVAETLLAFPSLKVPLQAFLHIVQPLQPRAYTIASSALVQPTRASVVVTVIDTPKPAAAAAGERDRRLQGVCSNQLLRATPGSRLLVYVKTSTFRLPSDPSTPIIMIGPGTGIAPMRAFLQERAHLQARGVAVGPAVLFFGCRRRDEDFIFQAELQSYQKAGVLTGLHLAFSRERADGSKVYVQHLVQEQAAALYPLLATGGAHVYVCGATQMGKDVHKALEAVFASGGGLPAAAAVAAVKQLQDTGRYVQELWG